MSKISGIEQILVDSLDYKSVKKSLLKGKRRTVKLVPATNNVFQGNSGQNIHFDLPANCFLDTSNTKLIYTLVGSTTDVDKDNLAFNEHIECVLNRVKWCLGDGTSQIEDLHQYNINSASLFKYKVSQDYANTISAIQEGFSPDLTVRNSWCINGRSYAVNLLASGVMNSNIKYLPLGLLSKGGGWNRSLTLDLYLESPQHCMINSTSNKSYIMSDVYLQLELIECPEYENNLLNKVKSGQMVVGIPYESANISNNQILAGQQGEVTFSIPNNYNQFLTGIRSIFLADSDNDIDYTYTFKKPIGMQGYNYLIKGEYYPTQQVTIDTNIDASQMNELLKYFNKNVRTYDRSIVDGLEVPDLPLSSRVLFSEGAILPILTPSDNLEVDLTTPFINQLWTLTTSTFSPATTGLYNLNISAVPFFYSSTGAASDIIVNMFIYDVTNSVQMTGSLVTLNRLGVTSLVSTSNDENGISVNIFNQLVAGNQYSFNFEMDVLSSVTARCEFLQPKLTAFLINSETAEKAAPSSSYNYMIAQTFKTFYDNGDFLSSAGEFMLDGISTEDASQLTMRMTLSDSEAERTSVLHFTDYIGCITIDSNAVNVVK